MNVNTKLMELPLVGITREEMLKLVLRAVNKFYNIDDSCENYLGHLSTIGDYGGTWVLGDIHVPKAIAEVAFYSDLNNFIADSSLFRKTLQRDTNYKLFDGRKGLELNTNTLREFDIFRENENNGIAEILIHEMTESLGIGDLTCKLGVNFFKLPVKFMESSEYFPDPHVTVAMLRKLEDVLKGKLLVTSTFADDTDYNREKCLVETNFAHQFTYGNNHLAFKLYAKPN